MNDQAEIKQKNDTEVIVDELLEKFIHLSAKADTETKED